MLKAIMEKAPIVFKCEDSLWRMLADGSKTFDMRRWDISDDRIYRLAWGHCAPASFGELRWIPSENQVAFLNKATGELLTFEYQSMEFTRWAPGWCVILLGKRIKG